MTPATVVYCTFYINMNNTWIITNYEASWYIILRKIDVDIVK